MFKKISFLATFLIVLILVLASGMLWGEAKQDEAMPVRQLPGHEPVSAAAPAAKTPAKAEDQAMPVEKPVVKQKWYEDQVVVLNYHDISDSRERRFEISPAEFQAHMEFLYQNDLHPISLTEFLRFVSTGVLMTDNAVLITFDDGYESYYTKAFPILQQYGFPSVNFLIAGRLRDTAERKRENMIMPLSEQQVKEMLATGLVDIGSHTYSLHQQVEKNEWGELAPDTAPVFVEELSRVEEEQEYRNRLYVDFVMSRVAVSNLAGKAVRVISYPFGFTNETVTEIAKEAGYHYAFNSHPGVVKADVDPFAIPRFGVGVHEIGVDQLRELFTKVKEVQP